MFTNLFSNLVLIGFQTCGKSTLGKKLSLCFKCPFIDTDEWMEKGHFPLTCREIYQTYGELYFREKENQINQVIASRSSHVIAVGGGAALDYFNSSTQFIYLKTSLPVLKKRLKITLSPPAYLKNQNLETLYLQRTLYYEKWASYTLEMDDLTLEEAIQQLETFYGF